MKHAYLIMAHNEFYILEKLIKLIDDNDNDIYIHIDKKVKNFDFEKYKNLSLKSKIVFTKRINVSWGGDSQIKCELLLLEAAIKNNYDYYHLLSGVDLPLKKQKEIHQFFKDNNGKEFVHFTYFHPINDERISRVKYYHLFCKNIRSSSKVKSFISSKLYNLIKKIQIKININRVKNEEFMYGANWFSITNNFAHYVLDKKRYIKKRFKKTHCADEIFLQTICYNSPYYDNLYLKKDDDYKQIMRFIDWNRGNPYTFKIDDLNELINSEMLFARKFSSKVDKEIIDKIYETVIK